MAILDNGLVSEYMSFNATDYKLIEAYLENKATQGLIFVKVDTNTYYFEKTEPMNLKYKVCYLEEEEEIPGVYGSSEEIITDRDGDKAIILQNPKVTEDWKEKLDEYEWVQVCRNAKVRVLVSAKNSPKDININKKSFLKSMKAGNMSYVAAFPYIILLAVLNATGSAYDKILESYFSWIFAGILIIVAAGIVFRYLYLYFVNRKRIKSNEPMLSYSVGNSRTANVVSNISILSMFAIYAFNGNVTVFVTLSIVSLLASICMVLLSCFPKKSFLKDKCDKSSFKAEKAFDLIVAGAIVCVCAFLFVYSLIGDNKEITTYNIKNDIPNGAMGSKGYEEDIYHDSMPVSLEDFGVKIKDEAGNSKRADINKCGVGITERYVQEVYLSDGLYEALDMIVYKPYFNCFVGCIENDFLKEYGHLKDITDKENDKWNAKKVYTEEYDNKRILVYDDKVVYLDINVDKYEQRKFYTDKNIDIIKQGLKL